MNFFKNLFVFFVVIFSIASCQSTPNHMHEPFNSTESGSFADGSYDSGSNKYDTLSPAQPNGIDTTGEQTGRMNSAPVH
jgi:hypothetical protein